MLNKTVFSPEKVFTESRKFLHQRTFTPPVLHQKHPEALCTTILWHQKHVAPHRFYTCRWIFHHTSFTPKALYAPRKAQSEYAHTTQPWSAKHHTTTHIQGPGMQNTKDCTASPIVWCKTRYVNNVQHNHAMLNTRRVDWSSATIWSYALQDYGWKTQKEYSKYDNPARQQNAWNLHYYSWVRMQNTMDEYDDAAWQRNTWNVDCL